MTAYRLFPSTSGPASPTGYAGPFEAGVIFSVSAAVWLDGFWWWCPAGGDTGAQKFALWALYSTQLGAVVPAATVTSGTLTAGAWNYIALSSPVPLSQGIPYVAATGWTSVNGFPDTENQFGSGQPFAAGITDGPLFAYSDLGGSDPAPFTMAQGLFSTAGTDPSTHLPISGSNSANFWMDVQIDDAVPAGATYRIWPAYPHPAQSAGNTSGFTLATEFSLSESCSLTRIWHYSPSGATSLPSECAIWDVSGQTVVSGTLNASPSWSGAAGSGWVSCDYTSSGVTLAASTNYKVAVFDAGGDTWWATLPNYWTSGAGASGWTYGPLTAPRNTGASPSQGSYHAGAWAYPGTDPGNGEAYFVDAEVTPASPPPAGSSGLLMASFP